MLQLASRPVRWFLPCLCVAAISLSANLVSAADVVLIEEHWELRVGGPDPVRSAPQVTMVMSPVGNLDNDFFLLSLNHWTDSDFAPGGLQIQRWRGEHALESANSSNYAPLEADNEVITWTQRLSLVNGTLRFEVIDGTSQSWGAFGTSGELHLTHPTELTRLNEYQPGISLGQSGIGYAGNRVSSLVLQKLRWQTADGQVSELEAPIDIDTDIDP